MAGLAGMPPAHHLSNYSPQIQLFSYLEVMRRLGLLRHQAAGNAAEVSQAAVADALQMHTTPITAQTLHNLISMGNDVSKSVNTGNSHIQPSAHS